MFAALLVSVTSARITANSRIDQMYYTILPANNTSSPYEAALVIVSGYGIKHEAYISLGREIQLQCPMKLWVVLHSFTKSLVHKFKESIQHLKKIGMETENVFLTGHGEGGLEVQLLAHASMKILSGVILLGSYLHRKLSYTDFPVPIFTIVGDLDGVNRITRIAEAFKKLSKEVSADVEMLTKAPMVIIEGANHGSFSDNTLTDSMIPLDIPAELSADQVRKQIAEYIRIFISYNTEISYTEMPAQQESIERWYKSTEMRLQPLLLMSNTEGEDNCASPWLSTLQMWLSGLDGKDTQRLKVSSCVIDTDRNVTPDLQILKNYGSEPVLFLSAFLQFVQKQNTGEDNAKIPQSPREIKARMFSAERIRAHLKNTTAARILTCKDLNYAAFVTALSMASGKARERYYAQHLGAIFHDDIVVKTLTEWEQSELRIESLLHEQHITSFVYQTETETVNGEVQEGEAGGGLYFCRLLPPTRVLEWIYVDSLQSGRYRMK